MRRGAAWSRAESLGGVLSLDETSRPFPRNVMQRVRVMLHTLRGATLQFLRTKMRSFATYLNRLADSLTTVPQLTYQASGGDLRTQCVLCFGDSITEGYFGIWPHATLAPPDRPALPVDVEGHEHTALRTHPYSIRLGQLLANDVGDGAGGYKASLRYARARAYSGWTAEGLLPVLCRSLREGPWRCAVLMAGVNDIIWEQASAATVLQRLEDLCCACEAVGVPVVVLTNPEADLGEFFTAPEELAERTAALAAVADGVLRMRKRRAVADVRTALPLQPEFFDDALHPSPAGSDKLAEVVFQTIKFHGL